MKILHTADWHIGKQLYKHALDEELLLFFEWMIQTIKDEKIDLLLIAGDVFDLANPSHQSRRIYYDILSRLIQVKVKVVIIGGNHDSITNLEAASELLTLLDVTIIGGASDDINNEIVEIDQKGDKVVIAAVPYLRDKDVRLGGDFDQDSDRIKRYQQGLIHHYQNIQSEIINKYNDGTPIIGMGHLYLQSAKISDSERDIQLGNLAAINAMDLMDLFDYTALGHIHKPQSFCDGKVRYSGSPISLSFSERNDDKTIIIIETGESGLKVTPFKVPKFRALIKLSGSFEKVKNDLKNIVKSKALQNYVEVEIIEEDYSLMMLEEVQSYFSNLENDEFKVLKERIRFNNSQRNLAELEPTKEIKDLKPIEVFEKRLLDEIITDEARINLIQHFYELEELAHNELNGR